MAEADSNGCGTDDAGRPDAEAEARQRLALTRVLIWAEREAASQGRGEVADKLREVISALHRTR